jgi:hypothetical protein
MLAGMGEGDAQGMILVAVLLPILVYLMWAEARSAARKVEARAAARSAEAAARSAEAAARSAEAAARNAEAALCHITVRRWDGRTSALVKLRLSLAHFRADALGAVGVAGQARLYTVRGDGWQERQPLTPATFAALLRSAQDEGGGELADVLVFQPLPGARAPARDALAARAAWGDDEEASSECSHDSVQSHFCTVILKRDGPACVLCRSSSPLEAARLIPRSAGQELLYKAGLLASNQPENGMLLCVPCHRLYAASMWCLDPASGVVVADALLRDAALGGAWGPRVGAQLRKPDVFANCWPPPSAWAASLGLFNDAQEARRARASAAPFSCSDCGTRWALPTGLIRHACRGAQVSATRHAPRALRRRASGGVAGGGGR